MTKKFMKKNGRDIGALQNLKIIIQRSSVNGNVKSRYAAREDFSMLVGRSYFLEYALSYFSMISLDDVPQKHIPAHTRKQKTVIRQKRKASFNPLLRILLLKSWENANLNKYV